MTQIKTPQRIAHEVFGESWSSMTTKQLMAAAIEADRAQRDDVIEKVRAYANDRAVHARHPILNQVGSGRIASDLFEILGLPYPFPEDEEEVESS